MSRLRDIHWSWANDVARLFLLHSLSHSRRDFHQIEALRRSNNRCFQARRPLFDFHFPEGHFGSSQLSDVQNRSTGEEGWDGTDAAYNDLMNNNIMPGSGRASQSQVQGNHTSFVKEKTNQFDAARFRESEMLYRLPSTGSF